MFRRNEPEEPRLDAAPAPEPEASRGARSATARATIGASITVRGDLEGEEDLVVDGRVEGTVNLRGNLLTVGAEGRVEATVDARVVEVHGKVRGDLNGVEQVVLHRTADVSGNISAPRVTLQDGCRFKGSIDMDREEAAPARTPKVADIKSASAEGGPDAGPLGT